MKDTVEVWLDKEIDDAESVWAMYRSYRQDESTGGVIALTRLRALNDVRSKLEELWGLSPRRS